MTNPRQQGLLDHIRRDRTRYENDGDLAEYAYGRVLGAHIDHLLDALGQVRTSK